MNVATLPVSSDTQTGADNLGDVVNGAAEEDADRRVIEMKERDYQRIDDHRDRAQRGHADDH